MGDSSWCDRCGHFLFSRDAGVCRCVLFKVYAISHDPDCEEPIDFWAVPDGMPENVLQSVAEEFADREDANVFDYGIAQGSPQEIAVERNGDRTVFTVSGEQTTTYSAKRVDGEASS